MKAPSQRKRRPVPGWRRALDRANATPTPWLWMTATLLLYASAGLVLVAFPVPYWIWTVALVGILLQSIALPGSRSLQRLEGFSGSLVGLLGILGAVALVVALSAAFNFVGTEKLNDIEPQKTGLEVLLLSLLAVLIAGLCASVGAKTGDRLIAPFKRLQASLILAATSVLGLGMGGMVGLLATKF